MSLTESKEIKQHMSWIGTTSSSNAAPSYAPLSGSIGSDATESRRRTKMKRAGYVKGAIAGIDAASGAGKTWTITLRKNGVDQAIVLDLANVTEIEDDANKVAFTKGNWLSWGIVPSGTPAGLYPAVSCIVVFEDTE